MECIIRIFSLQLQSRIQDLGIPGRHSALDAHDVLRVLLRHNTLDAHDAAGVHLHSSSTDPDHTPVREPLRPHSVLACAATRGSAKLLRGIARQPSSVVADCTASSDLEIFQLERALPAHSESMAATHPRCFGSIQTL